MKFRWNKFKYRTFCIFCPKSGKKSTFVSKIRDFDFSNWKKINFCSSRSEKFTKDFPYKFLYRDFFYKKNDITKGSLILLKIGSYRVQTKKIYWNLEKIWKKFRKVEKNPLLFRKLGILLSEKGSLILLKIGSDEVQTI